MKATERDYSELEGKEVDFIDYVGNECRALVVGCEYDIGVTLVSSDDPDEYLGCLHGPSDPYWTDEEKISEYYPAEFFCLVRMIKKGRVYSRKVAGAGRMSFDRILLSSEPSSATCPFNQ